jgi:integrase
MPRHISNDGKARELTVLAIKKYRARSEPREISDAKAKGLRLVVYPGGRMSWIIRLRRPDGRSAKLTLGPVDLSDKETSDEPVQGASLSLRQARELAAQIDRRRARNVDVVAEQQVAALRKRTGAADRPDNSFGVIVPKFFIEHRVKRWQTRPRQWREHAAILGLRYKPGCDPAITEPEIIRGSLVEVWADKAIKDIDKYAIEAAVDDARKHGSTGRARKMYSVLSVLFNWLPLKYRVDINPTLGVRRPGTPVSRERRLDESEIVLFWKACDRIGGVYGPLFKLLLLTACRLREVSKMTRGELVHYEVGNNTIWEIPSARTKNHVPHVVPLPQMAIDLINSVPTPSFTTSGDARRSRTAHSVEGGESLPQGGDSKSGRPDLVFTNDGRVPVVSFSRNKILLDKEMAKLAGHPIQPWCLHDLRRTASTIMNESPEDGGLGVAPHIVEATLNHSKISTVAGTYNRSKYLAEKRSALARFADHIEGLIAGRAAVVLPFSARKGG